MEIKIHSIHFDADRKLLDYINDKVTKLTLFFDNIITCEVFLKLDKSSDKENKITEIKILIPGKELFAKKQCKSFEEATDLVAEALRKQVVKHKEKI
ncbi:MAG: ribosome-associated translation inhibitor RaiA [Crocinitomicaceae bacterium]|jgi:putative sigma-54 modulation protein|nr:MAG: ribosome-associated translation inhibitor RaiA [Crocinitomicaceae bacterium]